MHKGMALLAGAAFLAVALAGCSSGGSGGFSISAPSDPGGEYVFKASGSADNYTWDLGDRLTIAYGKTVRHAYDFANGEVTVILTAKDGDKTDEHRKTIVLGTGANEQPTFILEGSTNWTVTGETIRFSAAKSTDPDSDPLRYTWSCVRTGPAVRTPVHVHPGFQGVPFATPPAGSVTAQNAVGELPAPDRVVEGDLCQTLGSGGRPSLHATIEGSFTETGVYDVYLLASDPVHPTTSGKYHFVVTTPEERPSPTHVITLNGALDGGSGGTLQSFNDAAQQNESLDMAHHSLSLPLNGLGGSVTMTEQGQFADANSLVWELRRGTLLVAQGTDDGAAVSLPMGELKQGTYGVDVKLTGLQSQYTVLVEVQLDMDPFKVY